MITENLQKISGSLTAMLGFALTGIGAGQLDRQLGDSKDLALFVIGMLITGLGGATWSKANSVTAQTKVAEAMKTAIEATPGASIDNATVSQAIKTTGTKIMKLKLSIFPLLLILAACSTLGIPSADTFNKKAAAAVVSVNTASQLTLTLLQAKKITPDESDRYIDRIEETQRSIDLARSMRSTDPIGATDKLGVTINALQALIAELESRK